MDRKGQATTFIILGIVIVAAVILVLYVRGQFFFGPVTPDSLTTRMVPIKEHIVSCIEEVSPEMIERLGMQGGFLTPGPDTYRKRESVPISYLCYSIEGEPTCYNRMLLTGTMESQLNEGIRKALATCVDVNQYKKGFEIQTGALNVVSDVGRETVLVTVQYPLTITKGDVRVSEEEFSVNFNYPLGALYDIAQDIVDVHTQTGSFDQLRYMLDHRGEYIIDVKKPYPDVHYILKQKDSSYVFQFMIQGESS